VCMDVFGVEAGAVEAAGGGLVVVQDKDGGVCLLRPRGVVRGEKRMVLTVVVTIRMAAPRTLPTHPPAPPAACAPAASEGRSVREPNTFACSVLPSSAPVLQCVAVCCSVLQCVAVCCSVIPSCAPAEGHPTANKFSRKVRCVVMVWSMFSRHLTCVDS